jgi:type VI secretion system protein VasG
VITKDNRSLFSRMNNHLTVAVQAAAGYSMTSSHADVLPEHLILKLLDDGTGDIPCILKAFEIDPEAVRTAIARVLDRLDRGGSGVPRPSRDLLELLEMAWIISSIHYGQNAIRSGAMIEAFVDDVRFSSTKFGELVAGINTKLLRAEFSRIVRDSSENVTEIVQKGERGEGPEARPAGKSALDTYTIDVTGRARGGEIDPVYGRDQEILQIVDILSRRRKNNPILVGEAGVGKTAVVEGLALRIVANDVIDSLKNTEIRGLDLGLLQAGAGVKGEFENRLKSVIKQVIESPTKIILFIDEAHTLIGAGGAAGVGDAANLLKPALARGQLRTIGATTWSEYKKYIEKDPALERRFQMVKIDEPSEEIGFVMLRGVKTVYETHHKLTITDAAVRSAVSLSKRYITGRQLPDKAVDVLDTASARVRMLASGKPERLDMAERKMQYLKQRLDSLNRDLVQGFLDDAPLAKDTEGEIEALAKQIDSLTDEWKQQRELADKILEKQKELENQQKETTPESEKKRAALLQELGAQRSALKSRQHDDPLVMIEVDTGVIASVIADWTGIPVGRMVKDQAASLLEFETEVGKKIIGQDYALREIASSIRVNKSGLGKPDSPIGVFLFVGPSGVGKSETARLIAEQLFGGEKMLTVINMSEYQEKHTVSQLKGAPPGYVGYGEGGILTEAVRRRPYSVVLLDEVEKADREVMNLFYQVFDKGFMRDGEGREIDFKNTVILLTSNLGSDVMTDTLTVQEKPTGEEMVELIRPALFRHFQPALLGRIKIVPFFPLDPTSIKQIVRLKLDGLAGRLRSAHKMTLQYDDGLVETMAARCNDVSSGARNVDHIIERVLLPDISRSLVERLASGTLPKTLVLSTGEAGAFSFEFV